jgi:hypothetical protein
MIFLQNAAPAWLTWPFLCLPGFHDGLLFCSRLTAEKVPEGKNERGEEVIAPETPRLPSRPIR